MRSLVVGIIGSAFLLIPAAAVAEGTTGTINYRATATYSDGTSADRLYSVTVADLDGDGVNDEGWLRAMCTNEVLTGLFFYSVKSPRDAASGQASGKRMHKPFTVTKEWGRTAGPAGKMVMWDIKEAKGSKVAGGGKPTYDVKKVEGTGARGAATVGKTSAMDDWHQVALKEGSPNLCADG